MLTSKNRSALRAMANKLEPIFQIGKGGVSPEMIRELFLVLEARELIKITVLKNSETSAKELLNELAEVTGSEPVAAIGSKIILYKRSRENRKIVLE